ncbi:MAG TPA: enoyl-CoA hydratase-related protein, partial [Hyphomicrobiales bacterium]|nr:enoyl-CoA hydratase-related protein [Hyphomicrobiales bacterium]
DRGPVGDRGRFAHARRFHEAHKSGLRAIVVLIPLFLGIAGFSGGVVMGMGKYQAMLLCLTGDFISAAEGLRMGVVSKVVPDCEVFETAMKMAERIARLPTLAVQSAKEMVLAGGDASLASALTMERKAMQVLFASADKKEAMTAFIEKRKPVLKGA